MIQNLIHHTINALIKLPKFRGRYRVLLFLLKFSRNTPTYYGPVIRSHPHDYTNRAAVMGDYGDRLKELIEEMPRNGVFLDIGANLGIYSLLAGNHLKEGKVVSFEPNQRVFTDLVENIELNALKNVVPFNCGVGPLTRVEYLSVDANHSGASHVASAQNPNTEGDPVVILSAGDIAHFLKLDLSRPILCKIDTEGFEFQILSALEDVGILTSIDQVFVEVNDKNLSRYGASSNELYELMQMNGFSPVDQVQQSGHHDAHFLKGG